MPGPPAVVAAMPLVPPRIGLVSSARPVTEPDERWINGYAYAGARCFDADQETPRDPCAGGADRLKQFDSGAQETAFQPFVVWAGDGCSTLGDSETDHAALARQRLGRAESFRIAREFWAGATAIAAGWDNRYLEDGNAESIGTGLCPEDALDCLEQALRECMGGEPGMIHAPGTLVSKWQAAYLLEAPRQGLLVTTFGTVIVPDAGYPVGDEATAYGTGMVDLRRSTVKIFGADASGVLRAENSREVRAEMLAGATWDGCCHLAVTADIELCPTGS